MSPVYAVYRVIVAFVFVILLIYVIIHDFIFPDALIDRVACCKPMHYGYWTYLMITVDFCIQVTQISKITSRYLKTIYSSVK